MYNMVLDGGYLGGNTLYGAMSEFNNFTDISGLDSNMQAFFGGAKKKGAKKKGAKKKGAKKKGAKKKAKGKRTPMRKVLSSKAKSMSKMRMNNIKKLTQRQKKLEKKIKKRKIRNNVINSLSSSKTISKKLESELSLSMKKFVSKIPKDDSNSSTYLYTSWPKVDKISTAEFEDARVGLADILKKKKPVYPERRSVIKFSDYKSKLTPKEKAALKAKSKKKGRSR